MRDVCCPPNSLRGLYVSNGGHLAHSRAVVGCPSGVSSALQDLGSALEETPGPETASEHCVESSGLDLPSLHLFHPFLGCFASRGFSASCGFQFWVGQSIMVLPWTISPPAALMCSMRNGGGVPCLCYLLQARFSWLCALFPPVLWSPRFACSRNTRIEETSPRKLTEPT